jgi:hypothetical protein
MKKFFLMNASSLLLLAAFGSIAGCNDSVIDPGRASEINAGFGGSYGESGGGGYIGETGNTGGSRKKPATLSYSAIYEDAVAKLDEIIVYCGSSPPPLLAASKIQAQTYKQILIDAGSSSWTRSGPANITSQAYMINSINTIISTLPDAVVMRECLVP